jgi:hypothetical protein
MLPKMEFALRKRVVRIFSVVKSPLPAFLKTNFDTLQHFLTILLKTFLQNVGLRPFASTESSALTPGHFQVELHVSVLPQSVAITEHFHRLFELTSFTNAC